MPFELSTYILSHQFPFDGSNTDNRIFAPSIHCNVNLLSNEHIVFQLL
ncbi:Uncharacterized protein BM_BM17650 [Brugia malayi]|uniref:Uncharacterized protein n=1 Tax=Brugia malayi TaxID=6279 RepID=A0A4E9FM83_BRUMA|nr:Uncharacterized protein BM_BM17650 [Brugia malayi]VIO96638.1 Uncharacterized protein BM_BM17650 [Brugia malayi]